MLEKPAKARLTTSFLILCAKSGTIVHCVFGPPSPSPYRPIRVPVALQGLPVPPQLLEREYRRRYGEEKEEKEEEKEEEGTATLQQLL